MSYETRNVIPDGKVSNRFFSPRPKGHQHPNKRACSPFFLSMVIQRLGSLSCSFLLRITGLISSRCCPMASLAPFLSPSNDEPLIQTSLTALDLRTWLRVTPTRTCSGRLPRIPCSLIESTCRPFYPPLNALELHDAIRGAHWRAQASLPNGDQATKVMYRRLRRCECSQRLDPNPVEI